ncbi:hypothetical protein ACB092_08G110100 [Castanea dentata]
MYSINSVISLYMGQRMSYLCFSYLCVFVSFFVVFSLFFLFQACLGLLILSLFFSFSILKRNCPAICGLFFWPFLPPYDGHVLDCYFHLALILFRFVGEISLIF